MLVLSQQEAKKGNISGPIAITASVTVQAEQITVGTIAFHWLINLIFRFDSSLHKCHVGVTFSPCQKHLFKNIQSAQSAFCIDHMIHMIFLCCLQETQ